MTNIEQAREWAKILEVDVDSEQGKLLVSMLAAFHEFMSKQGREPVKWMNANGNCISNALRSKGIDVYPNLRHFSIPLYRSPEVGEELVRAGSAILDQLGLFTNEYGDSQDLAYLLKLKDAWLSALSKGAQQKENEGDRSQKPSAGLSVGTVREDASPLSAATTIPVAPAHNPMGDKLGGLDPDILGPQFTDEMLTARRKRYNNVTALAYGDDAAHERCFGYTHGICDARHFYKQVLSSLLENLLMDPLFMNGSGEDREQKITHIAKTHDLTVRS